MTIGERPAERQHEDAPAPGEYELGSTIGKGPGYSIGEKREQRQDYTPGPGEYEAPDEEKKGVTIGERYKEKLPEDAPAPG